MQLQRDKRTAAKAPILAGALQDGMLTPAVADISFARGAALTASPLVALKLGTRPYFQQD